MKHRSGVTPASAGLVLALSLILAMPAAASSGSGYFRKGEVRQDYQHAIALSRESATHPGKRLVRVYLTTHPVDAQPVSREFDLDSAVTAQLEAVNGGMTRFVIDEDGQASDARFWMSEPSNDFSSSGYGELTLANRSETRIEGRYVLAEPESFFQETYQFDLTFATALTPADFSGDPLPEGGGEAGKAWLGYVDAVVMGDLDRLRVWFGEDAEWTLPKDDPESSMSYVEMLRSGVPATAKVTGGWTLSDKRALIRVEGKTSDGNVMRGTVLMLHSAGRWQEHQTDLLTVWE